jgi:hypothetical protein
MSSIHSYHTTSPHELSFNIQRKMSQHVSDNAPPSSSKSLSSCIQQTQQEVVASTTERQAKASISTSTKSPFPAHPLPVLTCHSCKAQTIQDIRKKNRWVKTCGECGHEADFSAGGWCGCSFDVVERNEWDGKN